MCENYYRQYGSNFISVMPTNLYGPGDNYDPESSHVIPALIHKIHQAKQDKEDIVVVWGSGKPRREFLYVDDMADACMFVFENLEAEELYGRNMAHLNLGTGKDITIKELALLISKIIGFDGKIKFDRSKPDGMPRKLLDVSRVARLGWKSNTDINTGIEKAYKAYLKESS